MVIMARTMIKILDRKFQTIEGPPWFSYKNIKASQLGPQNIILDKRKGTLWEIVPFVVVVCSVGDDGVVGVLMEEFISTR